MSLDEQHDGPVKGALADDAGTAMVLESVPGEALAVPNADWLLRAEFIHSGPDLLLRGPEGQTILIRNFFIHEQPPDLITKGGAVITPEMVAKLAGSLAPAQYAQVGPITDALAEPIGTIETLEGITLVTRANGTETVAQQGDSIFQGDVLETSKGGAIGIVFIDGSSFSLGEVGRMTMDEMVYDSAEQMGSAAISVVQGGFTFISGEIAKTGPDAMFINTPTATIGIRGTAMGGIVDKNGDVKAGLMQEKGGALGEITFTTPNGTTITINEVGQGVTVSNGGQMEQTSFSAQEMGQMVGNAMSAQPNTSQLDSDYQDAAQNAANDAQADEPIITDSGEPQQQLHDVQQGLADVAMEGAEQAKSYQVAMEIAHDFADKFQVQVQKDLQKINIKDIFREDQVLLQNVTELNTDYSNGAQSILDIVNTAAAAATSAGNAEDSAAAKATNIAAQLSVQATAVGVDLTTNEAQSLAEIVTAPLKSLGAAGAISATSSSISKAALALLGMVGTSTPPDASVIAALKAAADAAADAAIKVVKIVNAAITATEKVFIVAIAAATNAGGGKAAAAEAAAGAAFEAEINTALSDQASPGETLALTDLSDLLNNVTIQVQSAATNAAAKGNTPASLSNVLSYAVKTSAAADLSAEEAFQTVMLTDPTAIRTAATAALNHAKTAESERSNAADSVDETALRSKLNSTILDEFLEAIDTVNAAQAEAVQAVAAIESAADGLTAASDYIDGSAQTDVTAAKTAVTAKANAAATARLAAEAAAEDVTTARNTLADKMVAEAIAKAKATAQQAAADKAAALLDSTLGDLFPGKDLGSLSATDSVREAVQNTIAVLADATTAADAARSAADASPLNTVLEAQATLTAQGQANAQAAKDFADTLRSLFDGAATTAQNTATTAANAATTASGEVVTAKSALAGFETTADSKVTAVLDAFDLLATAKTILAKAEGHMVVARAAAEGQATASLDMAVADIKKTVDIAEAAANTVALKADEAEAAAKSGDLAATKAALAAAKTATQAVDAIKADAAVSLAEAQRAANLNYVAQGDDAVEVRTAKIAAAQAAYDATAKSAEAATLEVEAAQRAVTLAEVPGLEAAEAAAGQTLTADADQQNAAADLLKAELDARKSNHEESKSALAKAQVELDAAKAAYTQGGLAENLAAAQATYDLAVSTEAADAAKVSTVT